jgi:hypothetical protein
MPVPLDYHRPDKSDRTPWEILLKIVLVGAVCIAGALYLLVIILGLRSP